MKIGYMRVSTDDQDMALQEDALRRYGCEVVYAEKMSGKTVSRPELDSMLRRLVAGDSLVVWKLDRLGRGRAHLLTLLDELSARGVVFVSLTESFDTSTPMGRAMLGIMAVFAQMEREVIVERVTAGVRQARKKGGDWGRKIDHERDARVRVLLSTGKTCRAVARELGISKSAVSDAARRPVSDAARRGASEAGRRARV